MKNKPQAIIMGITTLVFLVGLIAFGIAHFQQSALRSDLRSDGIEVPVEGRSFLERDVRRISPNDPTSNGSIYSDDQVLFTFRLADGSEFTAVQPIAEDRYDDLGPIGGLTALYLPGEEDDAELLEDGEFVANIVPYWIFATLAGLFALAAGASAYFSSRPAAPKVKSGIGALADDQPTA